MTSKSKEIEIEDETTISSYEELLQEAINKQSGSANLTVKLKDIQNAIPVGNNYLSRLYRVSVEISKADHVVEEKVLIVKIFPKGELLQKLIKERCIFETEIIMYKNILPAINRVCSNTLSIPTFSAKFFDTGKDNMIVLEDLKQAGYKMVNRQPGLDLAHCEVAIRALARFHGISVALIDADKSILDILPATGSYEENVEKEGNIFRPQYMGLSEIVESWDGFERFGTKLRDVGSSVGEKLVRLKDPRNTELAVLNHGDFWLNNMLFKYSDTGAVEDIKFLDFQMTHFASPAIDLHYFLIINPGDEVKNKGTDTLLEIYHSELCRVLEDLGCGSKVVTLEWLKKEMNDKVFIALHTACTDLSLVVAEHDEVPDFSEIREDFALDGQKSIFHKSYCGAKYRQTLEKLLFVFEKIGVL